MTGVLLFGVVVLFVHRQPNWKPGVLPIVVVEYVLVAYSILAVSIAAVLKGRVGRERDASRRASLLLVGWAVGEGAALIGVIIFYITGQAQWYGLGLLAMVCSFAMLSPGVASVSAGGVDVRGDEEGRASRADRHARCCVDPSAARHLFDSLAR
jgi:hypothetical protein